MLCDRIGALVSERIELSDQSFASDSFTLADAPRKLANAERSKDALARRCGSRDEELGPIGLRLQRIQGREPLGHHPQRGRGAIVRKGVP